MGWLEDKQKVFLINLTTYNVFEVVIHNLESNQYIHFGKDEGKEVAFYRAGHNVLFEYDCTVNYPNEQYMHKCRWGRPDVVEYMIFTTEEKAKWYLKNHILPYDVHKHSFQADYHLKKYMESVSKIEIIENISNAIK